MDTMAKKLRSHEIEPDSPEYLDTWARDLIAAIGKREARLILAEYEIRSSDSKVTKKGRETANERAKILKKYI